MYQRFVDVRRHVETAKNNYLLKKNLCLTGFAFSQL